MMTVAGILAQRPGFEPLDRLGVEMVGRFVEEQQVGLFQQNHASATRRRSPPDSRRTGGRRAEAPARRTPRPSCGSSSQPPQASIRS